MRFSWMIRPRVVAPIAATTLVTVGLVAATYVHRSQRAGKAATVSAAANAVSQTLFIDPATGRPREATPAELEQLRQLQQATVAVAPEPIVSPTTGLQGLRLSDDQMVYSVATKRADGTIAFEEVVGKRRADAAVQRGSSPQILTVKKEARDDR